MLWHGRHAINGGTTVKETDRMKYLVVDAIDTISRQSDHIAADSAAGITDHLESILLEADDDQIDDIVTASLVVIGAIMKPIKETMLAATSDRNARAKLRRSDPSDEPITHTTSL